jgi:outer membrane lipoprotein carrier protein
MSHPNKLKTIRVERKQYITKSMHLLDRSILLLVSIILGSYAISAEAQGLFSCKDTTLLSNKAGMQELDRVQKAHAEVNSIKALFRQESFLQALEISEASTGEVVFARPGKMRWDYAEPEKQQFVFSDNTMWYYQEAQNQVLIDQASNVLLSDLPISFLLGLGDLRRDFELLSACKKEDGIVLDLKPKSDGKQINSQDTEEKGLKGFQLLIDSKSALPIGARVLDVGGNITTVVLKDLKLNAALDASIFNSNFPKGVDIQDRRKEKGSDL